AEASHGPAAPGGPAPSRAALVDAFWAEVRAAGTPLVEAIQGDEGHRAVTFVWRDRHDDPVGTRTVALLANKLTDPSVWAESVLVRLEGTDVWHRTYRLASDWRGTYHLAPDDGPVPAAAADAPQHGPRSRWAGVATHAVPDPFCRRHFAGKPGEPPTSVGELEHAPPQPWRERRADVPRGSLREVDLPAARLGGTRRGWIYEPHPEAVAEATGTFADPSAVAHDLLVLLDGEDWAHRLDLVSTLDNLLADGRIRPTVAVLVDAIDVPTRWRDLACDDTFTGFVTEELLPWARATLPVDPSPARATLSGRSLGGLTALYVALRAPEAFGAVHAQSASLWWPADDEARGPGWLAAELAAAAVLPAVVELEVGRQEWMLLGPHRDLAAALAPRADVATTLVEYEGGHDAYCWRGGLADTLVRVAAAR
ncbi:MAG: enterochelin esterase, partial [Patulibacter sp.]|nr:enterochelin esterase [Patulibacter sp.]